MLITITFPVDQEFNVALMSTLDASVVKHLLYYPFRAVINQFRRWWWLCATSTSVWLERDMEPL